MLSPTCLASFCKCVYVSSAILNFSAMASAAYPRTITLRIQGFLIFDGPSYCSVALVLKKDPPGSIDSRASSVCAGLQVRKTGLQGTLGPLIWLIGVVCMRTQKENLHMAPLSFTNGAGASGTYLDLLKADGYTLTYPTAVSDDSLYKQIKSAVCDKQRRE